MKHTTRLLAGLVALVGSQVPCAFAATNPGKPNIVLIMADDFGYEAVTANGGESYQTPNLDRLAATGMRFEHCYVQPLCTPTRVQLMTGIYNVRNYINFGTLDPKATTFGNLLKNAGYVTGICGKWQLGQDKDLPQRFGFDDALLWQHTRRPPRYANAGLERNAKELDHEHGEYGPKLINDFALEFVERHRERPFFLYYPMILTHDPFQPTPDSADWDPKTKSEQLQRDVKHFADMTAYMDKMVGRLVAKLEELGLRENTLVIFLGDNGTGIEVTSRFMGQPYPGGKASGTARGTHVPLIVNWPGHVPAGRMNTDLIASVDFLPTLCALAKTEVPPALRIDGQSFLPQILGEKGTPRESLYTWYVRDGGPRATFEFAMTTKYKLYRDGTFFDLTKDPYEEKPMKASGLSGAPAEVARRLQTELNRYRDVRPAHLMNMPDTSQNIRGKAGGAAGKKKKA